MATDPWAIRPEQFPSGGTRREQLAFCVGYAILAPSSHNTQPWFFRLRDDAVEVHADRLRSLPVVDPEDRELTLSCGACIETLSIAMTRFGLHHEVAILPEPSAPDVLARLTVTRTEPAVDDDALFDAIVRRHTNRVAFDEEPIARDIVLALETEPLAYGAWFLKVHGLDERIAVANLIEEGDCIQMASRSFRRELASWIHGNRSALRDGMPGYAFGIGDLASNMGPVVVRTFDVGESEAAKDRALALKSPLLGVIGTDEDAPREWIAAGRALARILLRATASGLGASFLNQAIEVAELRPRLAATLGRTGHPQLLLRLGHAPPARATPRRPTDAVVIGHAPGGS